MPQNRLQIGKVFRKMNSALQATKEGNIVIRLGSGSDILFIANVKPDEDVFTMIAGVGYAKTMKAKDLV